MVRKVTPSDNGLRARRRQRRPGGVEVLNEHPAPNGIATGSLNRAGPDRGDPRGYSEDPPTVGVGHDLGVRLVSESDEVLQELRSGPRIALTTPVPSYVVPLEHDGRWSPPTIGESSPVELPFGVDKIPQRRPVRHTQSILKIWARSKRGPMIAMCWVRVDR